MMKIKHLWAKFTNSEFFQQKKFRVAGKWPLFALLIYFAIKFLDFRDIAEIVRQIPFTAFLYYLSFLAVSRILYAYRWKIINNALVPDNSPHLTKFFTTNLLAEFFSIALPSSLGGEALRYIKIDAYNKDGIATSLAIFIDRIIGISAMVITSLVALLFISQDIQLDSTRWLIGDQWVFVFAGVIVLAMAAIFVFNKFIKKSDFFQRLKKAWKKIIQNRTLFLFAFLISIAAHVIFALSHIALFNVLHPLPPISVVAIILTPQLARSIPISVLGVSGGEGLMVFGQMLVGLTQNEALAITTTSLFARYFFTLCGLVVELLNDGVGVFKKR